MQYAGYDRILAAGLRQADADTKQRGMKRWLAFALVWQALVIVGCFVYAFVMTRAHPSGLAWIAPPIAALLGTALPYQLAVNRLLRTVRGVSPLVHRVRAVNEQGSNAMHDDEYARTLGFRGGLVPGAVVYGYMAVLPERRWGAAWRAGGTMSARFLKPFYDGEEVTVTASGEGGTLELEARNPAGDLCATGRAEAASGEAAPAPDHYPAPEVPSERRPPLEVVEGDALGVLRTELRLEPSWPPRLGNRVLMASVALPPWIHVETRARHLAEVRDGEPVEVRALVAGAWERRGHHFVDLDVLVLGESGQPAAQLRHIAIVQLAPPSADR